MRIAFLKYSQVTNPENIPGDWPAESFEYDETKITPPPEYTTFTKSQYDVYIQMHKPAYDIWRDKFKYDGSYLNSRYSEYPPLQLQLTALVDMAKKLYPIPESRPPEIKKIIEERDAVDAKFPPPI